jgi:hypothetical protein
VESLRDWVARTDLEGCRTGGESSKRDNLGPQDWVCVYWGRDDAAARGENRLFLDLNGIKDWAGGKDLRVLLVPANPSSMPKQAQVLSLLRRLSEAPQVRRLVVQDTSGQAVPVVDYTVSQRSNDPHDRPSNHVILVPSDCLRR